MTFPQLPPDVSVRAMLYSDQAQIRAFRCANENEPWTASVEELIQTKLLPAVWTAEHNCHVFVAVASSGQIVGINAVQLLGDPPTLASNWLLAVCHERRKEYIGLNLKLRAMRWCAELGLPLAVIESQVNEANEPMNNLNDKWLGAVVEPLADGPDGYRAVVVAFET